MNSLIQDKDLPINNNIQRQHNVSLTKSKLLNKPYSFFIFYKILTLADQKLTNLQVFFLSKKKLSFRLREEIQKQQNEKYIDNDSRNEKIVNLFFTNLDNENQMDNCLIELKFHIVENKTKLVVLGFQSDMLKIIDKTSQHGIDIKSIPFAIYSPQFNDDLSQFLGWKSQSIKYLAEKSSNQLSSLANQWITSPSEKIDMWEAIIKVKEDGKIQQLQYEIESKLYTLKQNQQTKQKKTYFLSNMTIGYHSKAFLELSSEQKPISQPPSIFSRWQYNFSGMKKFCCLGENSMKSSTGIVNISFKDDGNRQIQLMKQFVHDIQSEQMNEKKHKNKRKVLSVVLANIPVYNSQISLQASRMNDNKIELLAFDSKTNNNRIASIGGQIKFRFSTQKEVYLKIGDVSYVLQKPTEIIIKQVGKIKVLINKDTISC